MLKIEEFTDIEKIAELRRHCGRELDEHDNFSWHIALKEDGKLLGTARLYRFKDGLLIDKPCLYEYEKHRYEMLFRTLLLKANTIGKGYAYIEGNDPSLSAFGFSPFEGMMRADVKEIKFPKLCGGCKGCD